VQDSRCVAPTFTAMRGTRFGWLPTSWYIHSGILTGRASGSLGGRFFDHAPYAAFQRDGFSALRSPDSRDPGASG
jgi:hypothetical protein